jgi:hypothetical protein
MSTKIFWKSERNKIMKTILTVVLAMAATAGLSVAADKPNFSGEWAMDAAKSDFGPIPPPATMTRKVEHSDPAMTVTTIQTGGAQGDSTVTQKFATDGKETTNEMMGSPTKSTAKWDGGNLVVVTKGSLSADGKVLTDAWHLVTPQGEFDLTYVMNKK